MARDELFGIEDVPDIMHGEGKSEEDIQKVEECLKAA